MCLFRFLALALRVSPSRRDFEGIVRGKLEVSENFSRLLLLWVVVVVVVVAAVAVAVANISCEFDKLRVDTRLCQLGRTPVNRF